MSSSGAKDKPELQFPFLQDEGRGHAAGVQGRSSSCEACPGSASPRWPVHRGQVPGWHQDGVCRQLQDHPRRPGPSPGTSAAGRGPGCLLPRGMSGSWCWMIPTMSGSGWSSSSRLADQHQYQVVLVGQGGLAAGLCPAQGEEPVAAVSRRSEKAEAWAGEGLPAALLRLVPDDQKSSEALRKTGQMTFTGGWATTRPSRRSCDTVGGGVGGWGTQPYEPPC